MALYPTPLISRRFSNPFVTPSTRLATWERDMPHLARAVLDSSRGFTWTAPFSMATVTSSGTRNESSPFVPLILTVCPSTVAVTPDGTATGFLPTRDISILVLIQCGRGFGRPSGELRPVP